MEQKRAEVIEKIKKAKRIVVKVGSLLLAGEGTGIFKELAGEVNSLRRSGKEIVIVSSGSIAMGMKKIGSIPERQAAAALGQTALMAGYENAFANFDIDVAQVLLTNDDLADRRRFLNAKNTLCMLISHGVVPVINENDTVAVDEIKFGDNDNLAARTAQLIEADLCVLMSADVDGFYNKDPKKYDDAERVSFIEDIDDFDLDTESTDTNLYGTGGVASKISSARIAAHSGAITIALKGGGKDFITSIFSGQIDGTVIAPKEDRLTSKKHWIAYSSTPNGKVTVDEGGKSALVEGNKSLLPSGVADVEGNFEAGEVIHCLDKKGFEFARGMVNYSSKELEVIKGLKSVEIEGKLGYKVSDEVIHRDNLVVL